MKLGVMVCIAALSLAGCVDEVTTGGGQGEGILPEKNPGKVPTTANPIEEAGLGQILGQQPGRDFCADCTITSYAALDGDGYDQVQVVTDNFSVVCKIYLDQGAVVKDECGVWEPTRYDHATGQLGHKL